MAQRNGGPVCSGLVLAGGAGRRLGRDKALLEIGGVRLIDRALAVLAVITDDLVVARGDRPPLRLPHVREVADAPAGAGPLAGLAAGLQAARHDLVAVLAVDLPEASAPVLGRLLALHDGEHAVVPVVDGHRQPLHAVWHRSALSVIQTRLDAGHASLMGTLDALGVREVGPAGWRAQDPTGRFAFNVNLPGDLAAYGQDQPGR